MEYSISVENICKQYQLSHENSSDKRALRHVLGGKISDFLRSLRSTFRGKRRNSDTSLETFWALRDVSFSVKPGDRLGIIGRNGAGKSTLLKILSRITEPTSGRATIRGRVASLLEVGTGFHPELTGRENIFLNGSILGMRLQEIKAKFDAIVSFSGVERFLDTPVKRYSSGMFVRLAFSVAAHLDPEIMIIDEVLAVGDMEFQKRCLEKMETVSQKEGRTVLFVSHNMGLVTKLCPQSMVLADGEVKFIGASEQAVALYLGDDTKTNNYKQDLLSAERFYKEKPPVLSWLELRNEAGEETTTFETGKDMTVILGYRLPEKIRTGYCHISFFDSMHNRVLTVSSKHFSQPLSLGHEGFIKCTIRKVALVGDFHLDFEIGNSFPSNQDLDYVMNPVKVSIIQGAFYSREGILPGQGFVAQMSDWIVAE